MQERAELCRALLYAVVLSPHQLQPGTVVDILSLLEQLVGRVKAAGERGRFVGAHDSWSAGCRCLFSLCTVSAHDLAAAMLHLHMPLYQGTIGGCEQPLLES